MPPSPRPLTFARTPTPRRRRIKTLSTLLHNPTFALRALFTATLTPQPPLVLKILSTAPNLSVMTSAPTANSPLQHRRGLLCHLPTPTPPPPWLLTHVLSEGASLALHEGSGTSSAKTGTPNWTTALHHAVCCSDMILLQLALERGADIDTRDYRGRTAAHVAVLRSAEVPLLALLDAGASVDVVDSDGRTPLMDARGLWARASAGLRGRLEGLWAVLRVVVERQKVGFVDEMGCPLLVLAVRFGGVDCVRRVLEAGADVDSRDEGGWTALHEAARKGELEVVKVLVAAGADVGWKDGRGVKASGVVVRGKGEVRRWLRVEEKKEPVALVL